MTIRDLLNFLFKWKGTLIGSTMTVVAAAMTLAYVLPQTYESTASVVVEQNRAPTLRSALIPGVDSVSVMNTEMELIKSRTVLAAVVDELKPHERPQREAGAVKQFITDFNKSLADWGLTTEITAREAWIKRLARKVKVEPVIKSNVITITFGDQDPEWSTRITNAITDRFIRHHWDVYSESGNSERFLTQLNEARETLDRLRAQSAAFQQSASAPAIADSQRTLLGQLTAFREQRSDYEIELAALRAQYNDSRAEVQLVKRNISQLLQQEAEVNRDLLELESKGAKLAAIDADIRAAEDYYITFKRQYEEAQLAERSSVENINVRVSDRAVVPMRPAYSRLFILELAFAAGIMIAISLAVTFEYFDRRVSDPVLAEEILGVPDYGSVEEFGFFKSVLKRRLGRIIKPLSNA